MVKKTLIFIQTLLFSSMTAWGQDYYKINFDKNATKATDRYIKNIVWKNNIDGKQIIQIPEVDKNKVYQDLGEKMIYLTYTDTCSVHFDFIGDYMHSYIYVDFDRDGNFTHALEENGKIMESSNLRAYSYYQKRDSKGNSQNWENPQLIDPPTFSLPSSMKKGIYKVRFKIDWDNIDAGGNKTAGNDIVKNRGNIIDALLNVHESYSRIKTKSQNGRILDANGFEINNSLVDFGKKIDISLVPEEGYKTKNIVIKHGYFDDTENIHGVPQYRTEIIPASQLNGNKLTIPSNFIDGDVEISAQFVPVEMMEYPISFDKSSNTGNKYNLSLKDISVSINKGTNIPLSFTKAQDFPSYEYDKKTRLLASAGNDLKININYTAIVPMHAYCYIDYNQDGNFEVSDNEVVSYSYDKRKDSKGFSGDMHSVIELPEFTLPSTLSEGAYRMRIKIDCDNISPEGSEKILENGGKIIDVILVVGKEKGKLKLETRNGNIYGSDGSALLTMAEKNKGFSIKAVPVAAGYKADKIVIKHGVNLNGNEFINKNQQWRKDSIDFGTGMINIPAEMTDGDIEIFVNFRDQGADYKLVFSDEFNLPNGTLPDKNIWKNSPRYPSVQWARFLSDSPDVAFIKDGNLVLRAIPNPDKATDKAEMLSGGIESRHSFNFRFGRVECRALINPFVGNFPAIWMMPESSKGWPLAGEIDIFEQINTDDQVLSTVHSDYTNNHKVFHRNQGKLKMPMKDRYHTYAVEWEEEKLTFYADGKEVFVYDAQGEANREDWWPFNKSNFYLILNQSVGDGKTWFWAKAPDVNHTYEMQVDWIRVYQKKEKVSIQIPPLEYTITNSLRKEASVRIADGSTVTDVIIPATINKDGIEYKVTKVADFGFYNQKNLKSVTLMGNTSIGTGVFDGCSSLEKITVHSTIPPLADGMFNKYHPEISLSVPTESQWLYQSSDGWNKLNLTIEFDEKNNMLIPQNYPQENFPAKITMSRTFKKGWNTLCLPFNLSKEELAQYVSTGNSANEDKEIIRIVEMSYTSKTGVVSYNKQVDFLEAGKPYAVYFFHEPCCNTFDFGERPLRVGEPQKVLSTENGYTYIFRGTYNPITNLSTMNPNGKVYFLADGKFYSATDESKTSTKGFRAFVMGDNLLPSPHFYAADMVTNIQHTNVSPYHNNTIYSIQGMKINIPFEQLPKGIYIVNGNKIIK